MKHYPLLEQIDTPEQVQALPSEQIPALNKEIRTFLVDHVTETGGHLASNLGMVELTVAMHRVFHSPKDHIIFDVGHQSYIHKLLTGRRDQFHTLRQNGGLSGFPKRDESIHDPFGAGHASTSISAAIGMATADQMHGSDAYTICVVGDGAFTGGMIHEALNNVRKNLRLIIILNENEMSISPNTGRFANHLSRMRSTMEYYDMKNNTRQFLRNIPCIGETLTEVMKDVKQSIKNLLYHSNYFEDLGLYYLGPANGNDSETAETLLRVAKEAQQSVIIHFKTVKGKGWKPSEDAPDVFHAIPPTIYHSDAPSPVPMPDSFSDEFGTALLACIKERGNTRVITAAMTVGTGLRCIAEQMPEVLTDVGIAEGHAITYAAGLAAGGIHPVAAIYSSFLQRSYDNLIHDAALQHLPMTLAIDRAGYNEGDGVTHHGIFDVAMLSELPDAEIYTPISYASMRAALGTSFDNGKLTAIRYPKGQESPTLIQHFSKYAASSAPLKPDFSFQRTSPSVLIITYGRISAEAVLAKAQLTACGICTGILLLEQLTPYPQRAGEIAAYFTEHTRFVLFLEEGIYRGGAGMIYADLLAEECFQHRIRTHVMAIHDPFQPSESGRRMLETAGLDAASIVETIKKYIQ